MYMLLETFYKNWANSLCTGAKEFEYNETNGWDFF